MLTPEDRTDILKAVYGVPTAGVANNLTPELIQSMIDKLTNTSILDRYVGDTWIKLAPLTKKANIVHYRLTFDLHRI